MAQALRYHSTNQQAQSVSFRDALLKGQAPDRGLYMPGRIPQLTPAEIRSHATMTYAAIAFDVIGRFVGEEIAAADLRRLVEDAYDFDVPLEHVVGRRYVMRLDRGPTGSFKDFAARMMGRLMQHYLRGTGRRLLVLTATSGDTGSAVASAFYGLADVRVVVLFPRDEVTDRQRRQMTTLGRNVHVLALDAKFDDCQALVKQAFADPALGHLDLSSANSINIGRLVPQIVYYFYAFSLLRKDGDAEHVTFAVPSGNFGDMMGGVLAMKMGLPVRRFVIATNANDEFPRYLRSGRYEKIEPSRNCISSAMNVGHPSNLARLVALYGGVMDEKGTIHRPADLGRMRREIYAASVTDDETRDTIRSVYGEHRVTLEPHGAVAWAGLTKYLLENPQAQGDLLVSLETAHPAKFPDEIRRLLGFDPPLPPSLAGLDDKPEFVTSIAPRYEDFRRYLLAEFQP